MFQVPHRASDVHFLVGSQKLVLMAPDYNGIVVGIDVKYKEGWLYLQLQLQQLSIGEC